MKTSSTSSSSAGTRGGDGRPPLPKVLLAALVIVLAFEGFQQIYDLYFYLPTGVARRLEGQQEFGSTPLRMRLKSLVAYRGEEPGEIAIFGDSTAYIGLIPEVLTEGTGMSAYNYGTLRREGILSSRLLLSNLVRNPEQQPKVLVLAFSPFALAAREIYQDGLRYTYSHGNTRLLVEEFGLAGWFESRIPTLRHQALFRELIEGRPWPGREDFDAIDSAIESAHDHRGRLPHHEQMVYRDRGDLTRYAQSFAIDAPIDAEQDRHLAAILEIAREHGIDVIAFMTPIVPVALDFYSAQPRWPTIEQYLDAQDERLPRIEILHVQSEFMDPRYFSDVMHLNGGGARRLSAIVAREIARLEGQQ